MDNIPIVFNQIYDISHAAKKALSAISSIKNYEKNELIQPIGSRCKTVYVIKKGAARIFYLKEGNDITEHFAFDNEVIVRAESLFTGNPTLKGIQAIEVTSLIAIDAPSLFTLYDEYHDIERLFRLIFEKEYVHTVKRIESLQFQSATERYADLLETTNLVDKIPLKYIASYLGITQVSLSRIRANFR
ncbi:MAG: Crp/Fnr family transcriptional regulator [Cyclobacteriaceae bacterium]|nr:Crp/Fnr family transcriptional regulator [Cyclobacteriaceae bacterium]